VDQAVALVGPLVEATLAEEGNVTYGFWADVLRPGVFRVYEEWADQDALDAHMASQHMADFIVGMASLPITGTEITTHVVAESSKLM
jgi:quinol monooxygenase YgiN